MYIRSGKLIAQPGRRGEFLDILKAAARLVIGLPGCRQYAVHADGEDEDAILVYEIWDSKAAHAASLQDERVRALIAQARPLIAGGETTLELDSQAQADEQTLRERLLSLKVNFAFVSAIVERQRDGETEILVQTRWKPDKDPVYSGTLEIQAGLLEQYEDIFDAVRREVFEETGLKVTGFKPDARSRMFSANGDECYAFAPFCVSQQVAGEWPRVGVVLVCTVEDKEPVPQPEEVRDIRWMKKAELKKILAETPEKIFVLQAGVLDYYLRMT
jgi:8-oxo-dGTP diphosphatase